MLVEERPRWHDDEECERGPTQSNVKRLVDVLRDKANKEGQDTRGIQHHNANQLGEFLTFEVLKVHEIHINFEGIMSMRTRVSVSAVQRLRPQTLH